LKPPPAAGIGWILSTGYGRTGVFAPEDRDLQLRDHFKVASLGWLCGLRDRTAAIGAPPGPVLHYLIATFCGRVCRQPDAHSV